MEPPICWPTLRVAEATPASPGATPKVPVFIDGGRDKPMPAPGALGDRYGRRRALIAGLTIFGAGSGSAMTASSATELIGLGAVLGLGAALVMPATLSTITGTFPGEQRTRAVSVWADVAGGAAVLGVVVSGLLLEEWSWPSVFGLNVVLAAIAIAGTIRFVPESADPKVPRVDIGGAILAVLGMVALVYSIIEAPTEGWTSVRTLAELAGGVVILAGFVAWELHRRAPLLDPRIFAQRNLAAGSLSIFAQFFALFGLIFISCSTCSSSGATPGCCRRSACCPWPPS
jgi:MFS family permease